MNKDTGEIWFQEKTDENRKVQYMANGQNKLPGSAPKKGLEELTPIIAERVTLACNTVTTNRVLHTHQLKEKTGKNRKAHQTANTQNKLPGQTTEEWEGLLPTIAEQATLTYTTVTIHCLLHTPKLEAPSNPRWAAS